MWNFSCWQCDAVDAELFGMKNVPPACILSDGRQGVLADDHTIDHFHLYHSFPLSLWS